MNINQQIKKYREKNHISQEELAEILFVSRQTISNWETKKTYPDLRSLLMMSDYFKTSLDELVKGDLDLMKQKLQVKEMNTWSIMAFGGILMGIVGGQLIMSFNLNKLYLIPVAGVLIFALYAAFKIEKIKKQEDIQTFKEIKAYLDHQELSEEEKSHELNQRKKHKISSILLKFLAGILFGVGISFVIDTLLNL